MSEYSDLESSFLEFIVLSTDPNPPEDRFTRETLLGKKIAEMIDSLSPNEKRYWIGRILGFAAGATEGSRQATLRPGRN